MHDLQIQAWRGDVVESVHRVSAAVVDRDGTVLASAGDPDRVTFWRSAAKPFQALPLVEDGVLARFGLGGPELALACASHSSEPVHLAVADRFLAAIGCTEDDLACGPHPPLGPEVARAVVVAGTRLTARWSNCSGKHAGMLALARHHGWPTAGYHEAGHPVQERILQVVLRWTGLERRQLRLGRDGCTAMSFALPLRHMAHAYARLAGSVEPAAIAVRDAMMTHPELVGGEHRFCTELMRALPGVILAKVGAAGIYSAAVVPAQVGIALKIEDGDAIAAPLALLAVVRAVLPRLASSAQALLPDSLRRTWEEIPVPDTRGQRVGVVRAGGTLRFHDSAR
jgi:L-asparaginase II